MVKLKLVAIAALVSFMIPGIAVAQGDPARGKTLYAQCMACHKLDKSGKSTIGPNLFGIVGREIASVKGFNYSPAMKQKKGKWTAKELDIYLAAPTKAVPGNRMPYVGMSKPDDRKALIAYLVSASK
jgi:cytochrome c